VLQERLEGVDLHLHRAEAAGDLDTMVPDLEQTHEEPIVRGAYPVGEAVALLQCLGDAPGVVGDVALVEAQPLLRFPFGVSDHLDAPGAGESRPLCDPAVSAQDGFVPPDIGASAEPLEHALDGCSAEDLLDDGEDLGNGQPDPYRDDLPVHRWPAGTGGCGCRGGQPTKLVHRHRRSGRVLPPILQKELDIALRQLILVPAGAGGKDSVVAEALGAGEANIDESAPSGQASDDVAHADLAPLAPEEIAGDEDLLPGGLDGDL